MKIAIVILSAGRSSRMGTAKQLLAIKKTTLLGVSIENALQSKADQVFCVLGANAQMIQESISHFNVEIIFNKNYKSGLSSSIAVSTNHIKNKNFDAVLVMLADQPKVDSKYLNALMLSSEKNSNKIIASKYVQSFGVPAIFPKVYYKELLQLKGDKGAKDFLHANRKQVISIKSEKLIDIDTRDDYLNFLKTL